MTSVSQKLQVLESLSVLDAAQTEEVLRYIRNLVAASHNDMRYKNYKRQAMKQIRRALRTSRQLHSDRTTA